MDQGPQRIAYSGELALVRGQARSVHLKSLAVAALLTALVVAIPW